MPAVSLTMTNKINLHFFHDLIKSTTNPFYLQQYSFKTLSKPLSKKEKFYQIISELIMVLKPKTHSRIVVISTKNGLPVN